MLFLMVTFPKKEMITIIFSPIDYKNWKHAETFYYFSQMAPTGYSITVNTDITLLRKTLKANNIRFFPAYLWLITRNLNKQTEFKIAMQDGMLGYYDTLTPLYATFHDDDKTFSLMWTEYTDSFADFYKSYLENKDTFGLKHGILCQPKTPPANAYTVSCIPWVSFSHFAVHTYENKAYYFPSVEAGKFFEQNGHIFMPLSMTVHHATTDGYHISEFLKCLQYDMNHFEQYL